MSRINWLILDAMGVIFSQEDDLREVFLPHFEKQAFSFGNGNIRQIIESIYLHLTLGEIDSGQFFNFLNIAQPDLGFLLQVTLDPNFTDFVRQVKKSQQIAVLSNDSQEWANFRNHQLGLRTLVKHYVTSSLLGARKPDRKAYVKMCWLLEAKPQDCTYVDNLESNLGPAKELGMRVILFRRQGKINSSYPVVGSFLELQQMISDGEKNHE